MAASSNGRAKDWREGLTRRVRVDPREPAEGLPGGLPPGSPGRGVVIAGVLLVLILWGGFSVAFRQWKAGYQARAEFGARQVAAAVDPMAGVPPPPGVSPEGWRRAVAETHAMLVTLTASNLLDMPALRALRDEVGDRVARARSRPETALDELAGLWDDASRRAGPVLDRHPRPEILPPPRSGPGAPRPGG